METTNQALSDPYTILNDRVLWYDGDSSYTVKGLINKMLSGDDNWINCFVVDPDEFSVKRYNVLTDGEKLKEKQSLNISDNAFEWNIPDTYKNLSVDNVIYSIFNDEAGFIDDVSEIDRRYNRIKLELELWKSNGLYDLLKALMFIIDTFNENNIIWGTGRGSSCCSYVLYLIGVHDVDSVHYDLDITDFFRT